MVPVSSSVVLCLDQKHWFYVGNPSIFKNCFWECITVIYEVYYQIFFKVHSSIYT